MEQERIAVLDFGSQYAHLIAKRFRALGFYSEIVSPAAPLSAYKGVKGIVLSGGPASIYGEGAPPYNSSIFQLGIPILGTCYGHYVVAKENGGTVAKAAKGEFGFAELNKIAAACCPLFEGVSFPAQVWMSHQDEVAACPQGFEAVAFTADCRLAAVQNLKKRQFGLQFHAEVKDTPCGNAIFANFAHFCGMPRNWDEGKVLNLLIEKIKVDAGVVAAPDGSRAPKRKVLLFLSGGVDSTVAFALLNEALGQENVLGLHIDNGFMRKDESANIARSYKEAGFSNFIVRDASGEFLSAIKDEIDPQKKRKAVGETFIRVRDAIARELSLKEGEWLLGQGTLYPDVIESGGSENAKTIKTHHNRVEGIQALIERGLVIEPLKDLYKDEVRALGLKLGLPEELVWRHPFPGPGLSINVLCSDGEAARAKTGKSDELAAGDALLRLDLAGFFKARGVAGFESAFALPVKSVGVQGDFRTYAFPACLRFALDGSGKINALPPWDALDEASSFITNSVPAVNRSILLLWQKEGAECALQRARCVKARLDQVREADAIVLEELRRAGLYRKVFQHLTVSLPYAAAEERCSLVLRPVFSEDVMTARFAKLPADVLFKMIERIAALGFADAIYYDITNKPPATFGWE